MPSPDTTRAALLDPTKDYGHRLTDIIKFLEATGWRGRSKGSHQIFSCPGVPFLINLQPDKSGKAKAYQVRQVRNLLQQFKL